jgi:hypothetical protein
MMPATIRDKPRSCGPTLRAAILPELPRPEPDDGVEVDDPARLVSGDLLVGQADLARERLVGEPGPSGQSPANGDGEAAPQFGIPWLYTALFRISRWRLGDATERKADPATGSK